MFTNWCRGAIDKAMTLHVNGPGFDSCRGKFFSFLFGCFVFVFLFRFVFTIFYLLFAVLETKGRSLVKKE